MIEETAVPTVAADAGATSTPSTVAGNETPRRRWRMARPRWQPMVWVAVLALLLAGWQWFETRQRLSAMQEEVARRLTAAEAVARDTRGLSKEVQEGVVALQGRIGALEGRLADFQSQQQALETLYQELARGRDEWTLAEVDQLVALAAQQLQLAGNAQAAVLALTNADARLARANRPQFLALRKALARDLDRLRGLPFVDVAGISVKLEGVVVSTDLLPLAFEERPRPERKLPAKKAAAPAKPAALSPPTILDGTWWSELGSDLWHEIRGLVRIQRFDRPEPVLLSPQQAFFLRENLKLRLLNARLALLARDQATFRGELKQAIGWLERHFNASDPAVQTALKTLAPLAAADVVIDLPNLNDTLAALRTVRLGRGKDGAQ